ncbi:aspartic peptidase domain-containing protein [Halenospora varia]|nr:aspartic peptidase domain-containing protein [Halenospora varia]
MRFLPFCPLLFAVDILSRASASPSVNVFSDVKEKRSGSTTGLVPLVVPPSQSWDGVDGKWSSLALSVGTPPQNVRVIVSTNSPQTIVPLPLGCTIDPVPVGCAYGRGGLFNPNLSSTWKDQGLFGINGNNVGFEANLGYTQNADYGLETLGVGYVASGASGPILVNQTVSAIATYSPFYLGIFGLGTQPVNYTNIGNFSAPSFFTSLRSQNLIPSLSWSYTAGAKYQLKSGQLAQLIFGGYDASRFVRNSANFTLASDINRDIVVAIQAITYSGTTQASLLTKPVFAFIESTDPNFWLPEAACQEFEKVFGLTLDANTGLYLMNASQYSDLHAKNPKVRFTLANSLSGGQSVDIALPFDAFALAASPPFTPNDTFYFPLRKAANDTQYTLGRAFLQEAYLTVNYERGNFSVSQCVWDDGAAAQLTTIHPLSGSSGATKMSNGIGAGAIAGIIIAVLVILATALGLAFFYLRRQRTRNAVIELIDRDDTSPTVSSTPIAPVKRDEEVGANEYYAPDSKEESELPVYIAPELSELSGAPEIHQLPEHDNREGDYATEARRMMSVRKASNTAELPGSGFLHELEASYPETPELESPNRSANVSPVIQPATVARSESSTSRRGPQRSETLRSDIVSPIDSPILPHLQAHGTREMSPLRSWLNGALTRERSGSQSTTVSSFSTPQRSRRPSSPSASPFTSRGPPTVAIPLSTHPSFQDLQNPR